DPARTIARSIVIATPIIALMFILGTSSVMAYIPLDQIDLISPIPQVLNIGLAPFGVASWIAPVAILMLLGRQIANVSFTFTGSTRLLVVAGWDELLPEWFTRLHARYRTPVNATLFVGAVVLALGLAGQIGVGQQEAFQLLENASGIFYALTYMV